MKRAPTFTDQKNQYCENTHSNQIQYLANPNQGPRAILHRQKNINLKICVETEKAKDN